jgi:signal transduction histidine kinase
MNLRTPINGIVGFSHILSKTNLSDEKRKEITSILASNSMQLLSIMEDLIEISKIESNNISLDIKQIELENFIFRII